MGDVITRFKLETTQFDSKLRDSAQSLSQLTKNLQMAGKDFDRFASQHVEAAKSLGKVESGATNLKDKLKDLVGAYNQVARAYNTLTKEQQQSDYGKALGASLQKLQGDIKRTKEEMNAVPGVLDKLASKFTVNIDAVKLFSIGLQAAEGALNVAKDAFFANEENLDEWGKTVESCESLYKGFLNALNTGDISGYLSNIGDIVRAARDAYDAMDELATFNAFNRVNLQRARTGLAESIANYREGTGSKEDVKKAGEAYKKELADRKKYEIDAYKATVREIAQQRGVDSGALMSALSGSYGSYKFIKGVMPSGKSASFVGTGFGGGGTFAEGTVTKTRLEELGRALREFNDTELDQLQALREKAYQTGEEIAGIDKQVARVMNGRQGGSGGGKSGKGKGKANTVFADDSIAWQEQEVSRLTKMWKEAGDAVRDDYATQLGYAKQKLAEMTGVFNPNNVRPIADLTGKAPSPDFSSDWKKKNERWYDATAPVVTDKIEFSEGLQQRMKELQKGGKDVAASWRTAATAISSVGNAMSGLQNPAIDIMMVIGQAVATIGLAYADTLAKDSSSKSNIWSFIAAAAAATVSMATTIASLHNATGYAQGGIVKGTSYSGDNIYAGNDTMVNAGELILNRSQQLAVASQLQGNSPFGGGRLVGKLRGADILISIERELAVTGKGQLATFR